MSDQNLKTVFISALISIVLSAIVSGIGVFTFQVWVNNTALIKTETNRSKREIKRVACFNALNIVDANWSNRIWSGFDSAGNPISVESFEKQPPPNIEDVRKCYNELSVSCDNVEVLKLYLSCLLDNVSADTIANFRNAIRVELGFGTEQHIDNSRSFIARLTSNQRVDPTVKTPVESGKVQGTAGHP